MGYVVGILAKELGCRVVGIAGAAEKCAYVKRELGFDDGLDHKAIADSKSMVAVMRM